MIMIMIKLFSMRMIQKQEGFYTLYNAPAATDTTRKQKNYGRKVPTTTPAATTTIICVKCASIYYCMYIHPLLSIGAFFIYFPPFGNCHTQNKTNILRFFSLSAKTKIHTSGKTQFCYGVTTLQWVRPA
jgi:hypothetical protein